MFFVLLNFFHIVIQCVMVCDEIFLEKVIAGMGKGCTFAPAFGRELGLSEGSTGAQVL